MAVEQTMKRVQRDREGQGRQIIPGEGSMLDRLPGPWPRAVTHEGAVVKGHLREGRFQRSLAVVTAISGVFTGIEVGYEHYRGSYGQRIMYTPLVLSFALAIAGVWTALSSGVARTVLRVVSYAAVVDGLIGFFFHIRGIARKPGGWRIPIFNLIMGPPLFAPLLFSTVGFLGVVTSYLRRERAPEHPLSSLPGFRRGSLRWLPPPVQRDEDRFRQEVREGRFQRTLGVVAALSTLFSWIEVSYSHYKNNFSYRVQWTPIITGIPLMIAGVGTVWSRRIGHVLLPITSLIAIANGAIGSLYHIRGVLRRPGGSKKPLYNVLYGPPVFAPLLFAASGLLGLIASFLRREGE